jgi:hypothetical protein
VQYDAEGVHVGGRRGLSTVQLFGRHIGERSDDSAGGGQRTGVLHGGRQSEVNEDRPAVDEKYVSRLQVPVEYTGGMGGGQTVAYL